MKLDLPEDYKKSALHSIAPYVGKLRADVVHSLIAKYSDEYTTIFDPFCGSGTVPLEAWIMGRKTVGVDLSYYAYVLSMAKLFHYTNFDVAKEQLSKYELTVKEKTCNVKERSIPDWIREFFHPDTLREIAAWTEVLVNNNDYFILACLLSILHHQRPGFLSYPSSNGAPYLRDTKYPKADYPEMYEYRNVHERLLKKLVRTYSEMPELCRSIEREIHYSDTLEVSNIPENTTIITSPPYMKSLTYARDNRMRLWFLGHPNWEELDTRISVGKEAFMRLMKGCFKQWSEIQRKDSYCIVVVGDILFDRKHKKALPDMICELAKERQYAAIGVVDYPINQKRKSVKIESKIKTEKICVFRRS